MNEPCATMKLGSMISTSITFIKSHHPPCEFKYITLSLVNHACVLGVLHYIMKCVVLISITFLTFKKKNMVTVCKSLLYLTLTVFRWSSFRFLSFSRQFVVFLCSVRISQSFSLKRSIFWNREINNQLNLKHSTYLTKMFEIQSTEHKMLDYLRFIIVNLSQFFHFNFQLFCSWWHLFKFLMKFPSGVFCVGLLLV